MKKFRLLLPTTKSLVVVLITFCFAGGANAAAILTLSGNATDAKYESDSEVRLSLIQWPEDEQLSAVETAWREYQDSDDLDAFLGALAEQETSGYMFSSAATGYRIKYAWKEETADGRTMHFLVTPGLKTRNPYMWQTPNRNSPDFSFVQVKLDNETGMAKSSLDGGVVFNEKGNLELQNFDNIDLFATMKDSTPYYLE